ncbi:alpha/beta fold hydrolase [Candidatus Chrysopegis kryptomonas]|uniref:2-hydroxymuconate semialdehyde hydrolase n=1 Tax=Candidatus Chryseopegocella kryptomonas TaxID=1633643 RepID=A0A0P1NZL4_9BACT|nr:alpha/beta hydrolase [Candidatus Chrysopegis kryptomonas]CUT05206.1 2-hydroxymuconate semialdehyde hydrolase [Candidatus Chrysopegis kryptomonas]
MASYQEFENKIELEMIDLKSLEAGEYQIIGGIKTHFHRAGLGKPLVFIHGSGPGVSAWANWRLTLPFFAENGFEVFAPDVVGFGYTERPENFEYNHKSRVKHIVDFIKHFDLKEVNIVGNSMGGALALAVALEIPERIRKLVIMGSVGVKFPITEGLEFIWGYKPSIENMRKVIWYLSSNPELVGEELVRLRYEASIQPGFQETYEKMFYPPYQKHLDEMDVEDRLSEIKIPTLVIHGKLDKVIPYQISIRIFEKLPNAHLHIFGDCGHWTQIEKKDEFNELVKDFLLVD